MSEATKKRRVRRSSLPEFPQRCMCYLLLKGNLEQKCCDEAWVLQASVLPRQGPGASDALSSGSRARGLLAVLSASLGARRRVVRVWSPGPCKGTAKGSGHLTLGAIQTTGCSVGEFGSLEGHGDGLRVPDNLPNNVRGKVTTRAAPV